MALVTIQFRDTQTGDEATHEYETALNVADDVDDEEGFYWTDGNGACDCERMRILHSALGKPDPHIECSSERVVIVKATFDGVSKDWK